ncbi:PilN domain-containing protein [Desulfobacterium sp. N47]|uniref:PilN domain-containing protein n=1 Tax=Desulfobacterium sp. N47 TaxID=3115210 RepID=UPI003F4A06E7
MVLVFIILIYRNFEQSGKIKEIHGKIESINIEIAKYAVINKELAEITKKLNNSNNRMEVIKGLEANRYEPVRLLDAFTSIIIPKRMWFVSLSSNGNNVNISGVAVDNQTVADFMTRLEASKLFNIVNLSMLRKDTASSKPASFKHFEILCIKNTPNIIAKNGAKK